MYPFRGKIFLITKVTADCSGDSPPPALSLVRVPRKYSRAR